MEARPFSITAPSPSQIPLLARRLARDVVWLVIGMAILSIILKLLVGG